MSNADDATITRKELVKLFMATGMKKKEAQESVQSIFMGVTILRLSDNFEQMVNEMSKGDE